MSTSPSTVCADCAVRDAAFCGALSDDELRQLNAIGRRRRLARGETIEWAGEEAVIFANVIDGVIRLSSTSADGREQIVGLLYPADPLGRLFAVEVAHDATALTDAELCLFPRAAFERLLPGWPQLERQLLRRTLAELDDTRRWMLLLGRKSAAAKVAGFLLQLTARLQPVGGSGSGGSAPTYTLPLTRGQIADVLGLTIETVSRQMTRMRHEGVVALPDIRSITLLDRARLEALASEG